MPCNGLELAVQISVAVGCYLCLLGATGEWKKEDTKWLLSSLRPAKQAKIVNKL